VKVGNLKKLKDYKKAVLASMKGAGSAPPAYDPSNPPPIDVTKLPSLPEFLSSNAAQVAANKAQAQLLQQTAADGDLAGLDAIGKVLGPSPKLKDYHAKLVAGVKDQIANPPPPPPPPPKALKSAYTEHAAKLPSKPSAGAKKAGYWAEIADLGGVPTGVPKGEGWVAQPGAAYWKTGEASWSKLPKTEREAVRAYTGGAYHKMNATLRGIADHGSTVTARAKAAARGVIKASVPLKPGEMLSRKHDGNMSNLKVGSVVSDPGVLSTSKSPNTWHGNVKWHMTVGHGVKGVLADSFSMNGGEREVILPPNQRMLCDGNQQVRFERLGSQGCHSAV
jgi:hypothetical protein